MPVLGDQGIVEVEPEKKKKQAEKGLYEIKQAVRSQGLGRDVHPFIVAIGERAKEIHPQLLGRNPGLAAELLLGPTKTRQLNKVSRAAYEGWRQHVSEVQATQIRAGVEAFTQQDPQTVAVSKKLAAAPLDIRTALYNFAANKELTDADKQALKTFAGTDNPALVFEIVTGQPLGTIPGDVELLGQPFMIAPGGLLGMGTAAFLMAGEGIGKTLGIKQLEWAGHQATTAINFVEQNATAGLLGGGVHPEYFQSWGEVSRGAHGPVSQFVADRMGVDVDDPSHQTLFASLDMGESLVGQVVMFAGLMKLHTAITATEAGGGAFSGEAYASSRVLGGVRVGNKAWDVIQTTAADTVRPALIDSIKGMTPQLADELSRATTRAEVSRVQARYIDEVPNVEIPKVQEQLNQVTDDLAAFEGTRPGIGNVGEIRTLTAEKVALGQRLADLQAHETVFEFPRRSRMQSVMRGVGTKTLTGRAFSYLFGETGVFDVSKFSNDLTRADTRLHDPSATVRPEGWASDNAKALRITMNEAKVPKPTQARIVDEMFAVERGDISFYDWQRHIEDAYREGLSRGGKRVIGADAERQIRVSNASVEDRMHAPIEVTHTLPDGTVLSQVVNVLHDKHGNPLPSRPTQVLKDRYYLPDMKVLADGTSTIRYFDRWAKNQPYVGKAYGVLRMPLDVVQTVFEAARVLRTLNLVTELPRLWSKIESDGTLRDFIYGLTPFKAWTRSKTDFVEAGIPVEPGMRGATTRELVPKDAAGNPDITALGLVSNEMLPEVSYVTTKMDTRGLDPNLRPRDADLVGRSVSDHVKELAADELTQRLALTGPEATLTWLRDHPESTLAVKVERDIRPNIEKAGVTDEVWMRSLDTEINQATGGDPALREAIGTGRWRVGRDVPTGEAIERQLVQDELTVAKDTLSRAENAVERQELNFRIEELERRSEWLGRHDQTGKSIPLSDSEAVTGEILNNWQTGSYKMPNEVLVRRPLAKTLNEGRKMTRTEKVREQSNRLNQFVYKGFKPLNKLAYKSARASMYRGILDTTYKDLLGRGYEAKAALEIAQRRAAFIAKDLHYDIGARSSVDRKLQNYFWFSAVWREQLSVYLYKLPRRAFWGPGLALEYGIAHTLMQGLKDLGLLQDLVVAHRDRKDITQPYFVIGGHAFSLGGLDPLSPGTAGVFPTLSPVAEAILDLTAKHAPAGLAPVFDFIAENFEYDKDKNQGPSFIPRPIVVLAEFFGVHAPMDTLSRSAWHEASNKAEVQARRWAMADLAKDGITPPTGEYVTDEDKQAAIDAYEAQVEARARHYELGLAFFHSLSAIVLPGSIRMENTSANAWYSWRYKTGPLADVTWDKMTDANYGVQNDYLLKHPDQWPYATGAHSYGRPGDSNYVPYNPDQTLDPDLYTQKAIEQVHFWADDAPAPEADPDKNPDDFAALSPRQKQKRTAQYATADVGGLTPVQADAVGLPDFEGREHLLNTIGQIEREYDRQYDYDLSDGQKALLSSHRDYLLAKAAGYYGNAGVAVLRYVISTPGERLKQAGYFSSPSIGIVLSGAQAVTRHALAEGSSPQGAAVTTGVLQMKVDLYRQLERMRQADPEFDREMRYAEIGLGERDGPRGRVAAYEYIFFSQPYDSFGYQASIVEAMR